MDEVIAIIFLPTTQIAIIMAFAEIAKTIGLEKKYIPLVDLILGIVCGVFVYWGVYDFTTSVSIGVIYGLSACGLFSGYKNLTKEGGKS